MAEMKRLRTIDQAYNAIKELDPESAVSRWFIREAVLNGEIPFFQVKSKRLIDLDDLISYINKNMYTMAERQGVK
ncbi:MAG: DNA-binding protein [Emergencia sp.]|nr:DNA-binding protein [Emergencia sp.]